MFSHIMIGANDVEKAKTFYDAVLGALGHQPGFVDDQGRCFYFTDAGVFALTVPIDGKPACHGNGSTIGFAAASSEAVDEWHAEGLKQGGSECEDPPGLRTAAVGQLYVAYLRDPSGNKICALHNLAS